MAKPSQRVYSPYAQEACQLLGGMIREARIGRRMTVGDLADRSGTSRGLVGRVERGDMGCAIGAYFEMAALLRIPLFGLEKEALSRHLMMTKGTLQLLPKSARKASGVINDDF